MQIEINGEARTFENAMSLCDLWEAEAQSLGVEDARGFAAALNGKLVPKTRWTETPVSDGDRIEIIRAMSGG